MYTINDAEMASERVHYDDIHSVHSLNSATEEDLRLVIRTFPIIDNHAHNLLKEEHAYSSQEHPFESITSEAQGHALHDHTYTSLAHIRGINQLADLFRCRPTYNDVKLARQELIQRDYGALIKTCLQGTHAIMMDDGLAPEMVNPVGWHKQFVPTVSRIVRIESVAAELLEQLVYTAGWMKPGRSLQWNKDQSEAFLVRFNTIFRNSIRTLAQDPLVRGFKSVVCYRSGLDITLESRNVFRPHQSLTESSLLSAFDSFLRQAVRTHKYRIEQKAVNDYLVVAVCDVLDKLIDTDGESLPIQFHTGLGDADIDLVKANPAYMKPIITAFPNVDFVLLHSSYPFTREAGYMATVYANAWLDIGLIFPMLSRDGQESALKQALELTPTSKILWSTDGHLHPETYYLANKQFRATLEKVLVVYTRTGDLSVSQAINTAVDILFWNSNHLYKLDEERKYPRLLEACGRLLRGSPVSNLTLSQAPEAYISLGASGPKETVINHQHASSANSRDRADPDISNTATPIASQASLLHTPPSLPYSTTDTTGEADAMATTQKHDIAAFDAFIQQNPSVKYIWITIIDYAGLSRLRMIPVAAFRKHLSSGNHPSITTALPDLLPADILAKGTEPTGQFRMSPDMSAISLNATLPSSSASVPAWWMEDNDSAPTEHYFACPRWALQRQLDALRAEFGLTILMGFEVEIIFVQPVLTSDKSDYAEFQMVNPVHAWSLVTDQSLDMLPMIEEIVEALAAADIVLDQFHPEAAPGQWEFPLPAFEPLKAIDVLYRARNIIRWVAKKHGLKATLYPRPYDFTCGSASHVHFSVNGASGAVEKYADPFLAGILKHLASILAFTLPTEESYARINAGIWAGGEWICWGSQNREVPLRKCGPGHWEMKTVDGMGNMYLSMAALLGSGLHGLRENLELTHKDNLGDASLLSSEQRKQLGITTMLPKTLKDSLASLDKDKALKEVVGQRLVSGYINFKKSEMELLNSKEEKERRRWLIARY